MRKSVLLFFLTIFYSAVFSQNVVSDSDALDVVVAKKPQTCKGKRIYIVPLGDKGRYLNGSGFKYSPGDTLVLQGKYNEWSYFTLDNFHGTSSCPVVIINEGLVRFNYSSIAINNSTYIKLTGSGDPRNFYGFYMHDLHGPAVNVTGRSAFIEIERVEGHNSFGGAWLKQDPLCDPKYNAGEIVGKKPVLYKDRWYMDHVSIHDCKFTDIPFDVIYAGNTAPNGGRLINCNGKMKNYIPMHVSNFKIYNNIIDGAVRTGIQLSGADQGTNEIYNNRITRVGYEYNADQGAGIIVGSSGHAYVHDNYIRQTWTYGILVLGSDLNIVENNDIDSSGYLGRRVNTVLQPTSIMYSATGSLPPAKAKFYIRNNSLGKNVDKRKRQIIVWDGGNKFDAGNIICNNTNKAGGAAVAFVNPGIQFSACGGTTNKSPVAIAGNDITVNLTARNVTLDGSKSYDPDGKIVYYKWTKLQGPVGSIIKGNGLQAKVQLEKLVLGVHMYQLTVKDNKGAVSHDTVKVTVKILGGGNTPPIANAGSNKTVDLFATNVYLDGSASSDPDGKIVHYEWWKVMGPKGRKVKGNRYQARILLQDLAAGVYLFELIVKDSKGAIDKDTVKVTVKNPGNKNLAPIAKAGWNKTVTAQDSKVFLKGSNSYDPDGGKIIYYKWEKIRGPRGHNVKGDRYKDIVQLQDLITGVYKFQLTVKDDEGAVGRDTVTVTVVPSNSNTVANTQILDSSLSSIDPKLNGDLNFEVNLYPNPVSDVLNVSLPATLTGKVGLNMYNLQGQSLQSKTVNKSFGSSNETFDVKSLRSGTYFLQIVTEHGRKTLKFVKS